MISIENAENYTDGVIYVQKTTELSDEQIEEIADSTPVDHINIGADCTWWLRFARKAIAADRKLRGDA